MGLLTEIRDLVQRLVGIKERPLPPRATSALRLGRGMKYLRVPKLAPYATVIAAWLEEGRTQREVIQLLGERGIRTTSGALSRFVRSRLMLGLEE